MKLLIVFGTIISLTACMTGGPRSWKLNRSEKKWKRQMETECLCEIRIEKGATYQGVNEVRDSTFSIFLFNMKDSTYKSMEISDLGTEVAKSYAPFREEPENVKYIEVCRGYVESVTYSIDTGEIR